MSKNVKIFLDKFLFFLIIKLTPDLKGYVGAPFLGRENFMLNNGGLMTIDDLAGYLKVTRRTIYDWLKQNKIPAIKLVGQWRFKKDKIDAWLENKALS